MIVNFALEDDRLRQRRVPSPDLSLSIFKDLTNENLEKLRIDGYLIYYFIEINYHFVIL